ncbi:hypothetical protein GALMADRAFT_231161 [Galerina marginata CBS 339.88]|uniref:Uncharacterized protein n=1 Tax=Galerina marginata (strain CBS 339.88) TaxID=685588 RepID=A0A067SLD9_GALM3|nr:hypothetical protein GALMADRAFT_231161 [Galerina marginata CBS 339.88]
MSDLFPDSRKTSLAPVRMLDLSEWKNFKAVDVPSGVVGLKVMYHDRQTIQEHICNEIG